MRSLLPFLVAAAAALAVASGAAAAPPDRFTFSEDFSYTDTSTCGFPVAVAGVFTNAIVDHSFATGTGTLELHQSTVATATANGVTLRENDRYTILVEIVDGVPVSAKHVGLLDSIAGPGGHVFLRTGQAVYQVVFDPVLGYYVDGPLLARHGIRAEFDAAAFCAAFG